MPLGFQEHFFFLTEHFLAPECLPSALPALPSSRSFCLIASEVVESSCFAVSSTSLPPQKGLCLTTETLPIQASTPTLSTLALCPRSAAPAFPEDRAFITLSVYSTLPFFQGNCPVVCFVGDHIYPPPPQQPPASAVKISNSPSRRPFFPLSPA